MTVILIHPDGNKTLPLVIDIGSGNWIHQSWINPNRIYNDYKKFFAAAPVKGNPELTLADGVTQEEVS